MIKKKGTTKEDKKVMRKGGNGKKKGLDVVENRDGEEEEQRTRRQSCRSVRIKTINFILADREFRRETNSSETAFPPAKTNKR